MGYFNIIKYLLRQIKIPLPYGKKLGAFAPIVISVKDSGLGYFGEPSAFSSVITCSANTAAERAWLIRAVLMPSSTS